MRLVVSGYYGFGNTGDEALLAGLLGTLRELDPGIEVTVLSGDPSETEALHAVAAIGRSRAGAILRALRAADGLLSGGGGLLQDWTSSRPVAYYAGVMCLARLAGRPYAVHAQGLGPLRYAPNRWLARSALRHAAHVSFRDPASLDLARGLGVTRPMQLAPDPALALRPPRTTPAGAGPIVVAVRGLSSANHLPAVRDALRMLSDEHRVLAVPMQEAVDRDATTAVIRDVAGAAAMSVSASWEERAAAIASASAVVGMRLHALVLAAAAGVPAVAVAYDPKVSHFAAQVGQPVAGDTVAPPEPRALADHVRALLRADPAPYLAAVERLRDQVRPATAAALDALRR